MDSRKFYLGLPCLTLLCPVGGQPLKRLYDHFRGGLPAGRVAYGRFLPFWRPYAYVLWALAPSIVFSSFPVIVPSEVTDDSIKKFAPRCHRHARFPVITWRHPRTEALLLRGGGFHGRGVGGQFCPGKQTTVTQNVSKMGLILDSLYPRPRPAPWTGLTDGHPQEVITY
jgi:hypothetical protein